MQFIMFQALLPFSEVGQYWWQNLGPDTEMPNASFLFKIWEIVQAGRLELAILLTQFPKWQDIGLHHQA